MSLLTKLFHYVMLCSTKHNIDSSHGLAHSMNILHFTKDIYDLELVKNKNLIKQEKVVFISAILHDMCDKKYMNEDEGVKDIVNFLHEEKVEPWEINVVKDIITTMSYSKVKSNGFPNLGEFQNTYNIVREADLLAAYDFDRCLAYRLTKSKSSIEETYKEACELFENRIFKHDKDKLFLTQYAKDNHMIFQTRSMEQISRWKSVINNQRLRI